MNFSVKIDKPSEKRKATIVIEATIRELLDFCDSLENAGEYGLAQDLKEQL